MTNRIARFLVLAATALAVGACGIGTQLAYHNIGMVYSNAAPMLTWMVDDYVDMNGAQKDWVKDRFSRTLAWHRTSELPAYRRLLEGLAEKAEEPYSPADVAGAIREMRSAYERAAEQLLPHIADFVMQLDSGQLASLEKKFGDDNRKVAKDHRASAGERVKRRAERSLMHFEEFTGRLTPSQRQLVLEHQRGYLDITEARLVERRARQAETLALLRAKPDRERLIAGLRRLIIDVDTLRRPEYREMLRTREQQTVAMIVALSETLSVEQRQHLQRRLRGYAAELRSLSGAT